MSTVNALTFDAGLLRGLPKTLQSEAALIQTVLLRFAPEAFEDGFALLAEEAPDT